MTDAPRPDLTAADWAAMRKHEVERTILDRGWPTYTEEVLLLALDALARQQEANARLTAELDLERRLDAARPNLVQRVCETAATNLARADAAEAHVVRVQATYQREFQVWFDRADRAEAALADRDATIARLRESYDELIYAVGKKYPDETRHQTALRYIRRAEESSGPAKAALPPAKEADRG